MMRSELRPLNAAVIFSQAELEAFVVQVGKDSFGTFHILTGYEGTGACFWCGRGFEGKRKRYCKGRDLDTGETAHWRQYHQHFSWTFARNWCLERYENRCANCGHTWRELYDEYTALIGMNIAYTKASLEVHHIIPLEGESREWTPYNLPWNLICFCHGCHLEVHAVMRGVTTETKLTKFDRALANGQLALAGMT